MSLLPLGPLIEPRSVDDDLPIGSELHVRPVHRARRRAFEVEPADVVAGAVAWTLELLLRLQPSRRTSEMSAIGKNGVDAFVFPYDPDPELLNIFVAHFSKRVVRRKPSLER